MMLAGPGQAGTLKLPEPPVIEIEGADPLPLVVSLSIPEDLASAIHTVKTSPFDKMRYPIGAYTVGLLEKNLGTAFARVVEPGPTRDGKAADVVLELSIESFDAVIPHPAYKPYTASVVYRIQVKDPAGDVLFTQTTSGSGQTSKGMMSGFKAQGLAAESAARAMNDAMKQLLEGLLDSRELRASGPEEE
jgi:hypothetical protein